MTQNNKDLLKSLKEKQFKGLQNAITKKRWADLLNEGKEWEVVQEQLQLGATNVTELAGVVLASNRQMIDEMTRIDLRLERIEKTLKLKPLKDD